MVNGAAAALFAVAAIVIGVVVLALLSRPRRISCVCCGRRAPSYRGLNVCQPCWLRYG